MARIVIRNSPANSGAGMSIKEAFDAVNTNFTELYDTYIVELISEAVQDIPSTFTGGIISNATEIVSTVSSTGVDSGALVVDGGVGIAGNLNIGGASYINGNLRIVGNVVTQHVTSNSLEILNTAVGALTVAGGVGINGILNVGGTASFGSELQIIGNVTSLGLVSDNITAVNLTTTDLNAVNLNASDLTATNLNANAAILTGLLDAENIVSVNFNTENITATNSTALVISTTNLTAEAINVTNLGAGDITSESLNSGNIASINITSNQISAPLILTDTIAPSERLVINGGVDINGNIFTNEITTSTTITAGNIEINGLINGTTRWFNGNLIINEGYGINGTSRVLTNFLQTGIGEATELGTGSLRSLGGGSINGNLFVGGNASFLSNTTISNSYVPTTSTDGGSPGQISWDDDYFYVYVGTQWIRFAKDSGSW